MTDDQPKSTIRGYVSPYLRTPLRSLREVQEQQEAEEPEREAGEKRQQAHRLRSQQSQSAAPERRLPAPA